MTKPTGMNRTMPQHIRQESLQAATTGMDRAADPLLMLSPEMIEALEEMLEALPGARRIPFVGCNQK